MANLHVSSHSPCTVPAVYSFDRQVISPQHSFFESLAEAQAMGVARVFALSRFVNPLNAKIFIFVTKY
ncbi:hypothetical protein HNQ59_002796 [Chitinivorax tropicus]|uniref:Uncharacterized protein n=1 Tax=Chitinivorax tropicus TaxID=714531 RepID=A0A840MJX1_9PROT|nr:hypothetical protein [Chitinivorax tropicus]MBB5019494.1 hypothetical protein [Chitinivorax tropicus]